MSAPDARDVIAATINDEGWTCEAHEPDPFGECQQCHATQLRTAQVALDALTEAGYVVTKLPEPSRTHGNREAKWTDRSSFAEPGYLKWSVGVTEGGIPFASARRGDGPGSRAAADHAAFGAALLAAASYAEAENAL